MITIRDKALEAALKKIAQQRKRPLTAVVIAALRKEVWNHKLLISGLGSL